MISNCYGISGSGGFWFGNTGQLSADSLPLILVHGGPGFSSFYLEPLLALHGTIPLVFWDQAGCGRSKERGERKAFTVESFVTELEDLRQMLGVAKMHLFGHSFGGLIIGEYAIRFPENVASTIFVSASLDIPLWKSDATRLRATLPLLTRMVLTEGDRTGNYFSPQYLAAFSEYASRFIYRFSEKPECMRRSEESSDARTYMTLWGPNEIVVSGVVKDYSFSPSLPGLRAPALFMCGRFDEATPEAHEYFASQVKGSRCVIFEDSAHHPHINETEAFCRRVAEFLV